MRRLVFTQLLCVLCCACINNSQSSQNQKEVAVDSRTIVDPNNRQDTVYFGYILGQKTQSITDRLIEEGQFNANTQIPKTYHYMYQNLIFTGYPFDFCVDEIKYDALLILADNEGNFIERTALF